MLYFVPDVIDGHSPAKVTGFAKKLLMNDDQSLRDLSVLCGRSLFWIGIVKTYPC